MSVAGVERVSADGSAALVARAASDERPMPISAAIVRGVVLPSPGGRAADVLHRLAAWRARGDRDADALHQVWLADG